MLAKKIKFTDFNNVEREETFYFNLSKSELIKLELFTEGGYEAMLNRIVETRDIPKIAKTFDAIIKLAFGRKSADGSRFEKSEQITNDFLSSAAYDELFSSFIEHPETFAEFLNGVIPSELRGQVEALNASDKA